MLNKIRKYIEKNELLIPEGKIIVGLSGGADSVVLLYVLKELGYECLAAHCNFHLRRKESNRDEAFVSQLTTDWNIPLFKTDFRTTSIARTRKISIEMAARDLRYDWFEKLRKEQNAQAICVGHHQDDNVETVLMNLIRGTGIKGMTGMRPKNEWVIRPLLAFSKQEIMTMIEENALPYVTDSTNLQSDVVRNRIRLELMPLLRSINPAVDDSIIRTIENMNEAYRAYWATIELFIPVVFDEKKNSIDKSQLKACEAPEALLYEILKKFDFIPDVIREIYASLDAQSGVEFHSQTHRLIKDRDKFLIRPLCKPKQPQSQSQPDESFLISSNKKLLFTGAPVKLEFQRRKKNTRLKINPDQKMAYLDADKMVFPLKLRRWKKGDRFQPLGMNGYQKLSDFFNNNKFTIDEKENTWVLTSGKDETIVWILGWRIDNRYKITDQTNNVFILKVL